MKRPRTIAQLGSLLVAGMASSTLAAELRIGSWSWSLPSSGGSGGSAGASVTVSNDSRGGYSGSVGLDLQLSNAPYGQQRRFYTVAQARSLAQLTAGYYRTYSFSETFDLNSVPAGTYYIVLVVSEYSNGTYYIRDGATAQRTFTISSPRPTYVPDVPDVIDIPFFPVGFPWCGAPGLLSLTATVAAMAGFRGFVRRRAA